jgi:hypothetical protein
MEQGTYIIFQDSTKCIQYKDKAAGQSNVVMKNYNRGNKGQTNHGSARSKTTIKTRASPGTDAHYTAERAREETYTECMSEETFQAQGGSISVQ